MKGKIINLYFINVLATMLILPILSMVLEATIRKSPLSTDLSAKYFIGWAIGVRLLIAGLRQSIRPQFTAEQIFNIRDSRDSLPFIRELGFANICMGLLGFVSFFNQEWRMPAAVAGGLYFGLAGFLHAFRKAATFNELIAKISDLFIFGVAVLYAVFTLSQTGWPA
ncbi:MAG TPA: DUF6790 family protein [Puia sp.]|nr:DUF6790 family protein [Puia sp.]